MKKNILVALFALMAVALNGNAQNNTYNMVIEMANGTKINIGPNDVKNISFNNGQLVMTGEDINSLVERQEKMQKQLDEMEQDLDYLRDNSSTPDLSGYATQEQAKELQAQIYELMKALEDLRDNSSTPDLSGYATQEQAKELQKQIYELMKALEDLEKNINTLDLSDYLTQEQAKAMITDLYEDLEKNINTLDLSDYATQEQAKELQAMIYALAEEIAKLKGN